MGLFDASGDLLELGAKELRVLGLMVVVAERLELGKLLFEVLEFVLGGSVSLDVVNPALLELCEALECLALDLNESM